jgi:MFS family permease
MTTTDATAVASLEPPRAARFAVAAIFCLNGLGLSNWIARIPDVKERFALSEGMLGLVLLCAAVGALIAQPSAGWLIGKVGSRRVTMVAALLFCLSVALPGMAPSVPALMAALFVFGGLNGGLDVAMNAQAAQVEGRYGRPIMASFHGLWSVGGLGGALLGGLAAGQGVSIGPHLLVVALVTCALMLVAIRGLVPDAGAPGTGPSFALPPPALVLMGLIAFGVLFCEGAIADWGAIYLRDTLGTGAGLAAAGYAVFSLTMAVGRLTGDWLTVRLGPTALVRGGGTLLTAGILLTLLSSAPVPAIAGFGLIGAGVSCIFPLILSAAARTPNVAPGTAIAAMATSGYTGFLVGPPLIGSIAEVLSLRGALGLLGLFGVLIVLAAGTIGRRGTAGAQSA